MKANSLRGERSVRGRGFWLAVLLFGGVLAARGADESELLDLLRSDAGTVEKCEACRQLRASGSARAVPVLENLLGGEERLAHAARHALEALPDPEAGAALRRALASAVGTGRAGLIDSLGWRRDRGAAAQIAAFLADPSEPVATAAAAALGRIGGDAALASLVEARDRPGPTVRAAVIEGILRVAEGFLAEGRDREAAALAEPLTRASEAAVVREAAHGLRFRAAGERMLDTLAAELEGGEPAARMAAMRLASGVRDPRATGVYTALLPRLGTAGRIGLLGALRDRGDRSASSAITGWVDAEASEVRVAALAALGTLGDASTVPSLVAAAASGKDEATRGAAREALLELTAPGVAEALAARLSGAAPALTTEIVRALGARGERSAVPALLDLARSDVEGTRRGAVAALGSLADERDLDALVRWLGGAPDDRGRDEARGVIEGLADRPGGMANVDVTPIIQAMGHAPLAARQALFGVMTRFPDPRLRTVWRTGLREADESLRRSAARALCDARDPELLPDLLALARSERDETLQILAVRGYARLATDGTVVPDRAKQGALMADLLPVAKRVEDRRHVLSALASVGHAQALVLAERLGTEAELRGDAEAACARIAQGMAASDSEAAEAMLEKLAKGASRDAVRAEAAAALKRLRPEWWVAGPYRVAGRQASDLFDVPFPPEQDGAEGVTWRRAPGSSDPARPGEVDLGGITGGDHCILYLKSRAYVPQGREVQLRIGTDDGIKLWVNGQVVHANNAVRGLTPDQDRARATLREGWNDLLAKITQHTAGCGMTFRVVGPDGAPVPGLRLEGGR